MDVAEASAVGEARREAVQAGVTVGLDENDQSRLAIIATELATNLLKHASPGLFLTGPDDDLAGAVQILALDHGPGIADMREAMRDGHSTAGTSGTGLGAIARLADTLEIQTSPKGTAILARVRRGGGGRPEARVGAVSVPIRGESVNGDGWAATPAADPRVIMVVDGLGHGLPAHEAAVVACEAFAKTKGSPANRLRDIHGPMQRTRGAAIAIAEIDAANGRMLYAGIGNISATILGAEARTSAVSMHGIIGHAIRDVREFTYRWRREDCLVMHSDGLTTRWDLDRYPGLLARDPALIAGVLWNDHRRPNDDSTVVVARSA